MLNGWSSFLIITILTWIQIYPKIIFKNPIILWEQRLFTISKEKYYFFQEIIILKQKVFKNSLEKSLEN